jgi:hypothetical protein
MGLAFRRAGCARTVQGVPSDRSFARIAEEKTYGHCQSRPTFGDLRAIAFDD